MFTLTALVEISFRSVGSAVVSNGRGPGSNSMGDNCIFRRYNVLYCYTCYISTQALSVINNTTTSIIDLVPTLGPPKAEPI